jgi:hypothetical protein
MKLDQIFAKAGFVILDAKKDDERFTILVRVPTQKTLVPARWKAWMDQVLGAAEKAKSWSIDVSKVFYSERGQMKYRWRIQLGGNIKQAQHMCVQAAINALRTGVEVTEIELIGQENLSPDPRNGKFRGAYKRGEADLASQVVAGAFTAIGS